MRVASSSSEASTSAEVLEAKRKAEEAKRRAEEKQRKDAEKAKKKAERRAKVLALNSKPTSTFKSASDTTVKTAAATQNPSGIQEVMKRTGNSKTIPSGVQDVARKGAQAARDIGFGGVIGGLGSRPGPSDHPNGLALDLMTKDVGVGDALVDFYKLNAKALGVKYLIWNKQIMSAPGFEPRPYSGVSDHTDHVHVSFNGSGAGGEIKTPGGTYGSGQTSSSGGGSGGGASGGGASGGVGSSGGSSGSGGGSSGSSGASGSGGSSGAQGGSGASETPSASAWPPKWWMNPPTFGSWGTMDAGAPEATKLGDILGRLEKAGIDKEEFFKKNPELEGKGDGFVVKAGTKLELPEGFWEQGGKAASSASPAVAATPAAATPAKAV